MNFLDRITDEAFRELVSFMLPSIVSVFLNTCFCSLVDSMYSYLYNIKGWAGYPAVPDYPAGFLILPDIRHVRLFGRELPDMDSE